VDFDNNDPFAGWSVVVYYSLPSDPPRNLTLFDGFDRVNQQSPITTMLSGFLVPKAGFDAKLGVITYEGDNTLTGDSLLFNGTTLTNAQNPAMNFFNSTRSFLGAAVSNPGDLPQLTGTAQSMGGIDLDVVDVTALVKAGDKSATVQATSTGDNYL